MRVRGATLIKRSTEDGLVEIEDDVPVGRRYVVDLDSRKVIEMFHIPTRKWHEKEVVYAKREGEEDDSWAIYVTELLSIDGEAANSTSGEIGGGHE